MDKKGYLHRDIEFAAKLRSTSSLTEPPSELYQLKRALDNLDYELDKLKAEVDFCPCLSEKIK